MPYQYKRDQRRRDPGKAVLLGTAALVALALIIALALRGGRGGEPDIPATVGNLQNLMSTANTPAPPRPEAPTQGPEATEAVVEPTPEPTPEATAAPTPATMYASHNIVDPYLMVRPLASEGFMPIFRKANYLTEKVIAVTVDDFYQYANARTIIDLALSVGGKLTLFPIGQNTEHLHDTLTYAYENGFELENHTWSHDGLYGDTDEELAEHIYKADAMMDMILGVDYQMHFLRPRGGDDRNDQRTHAYIKQLGYYGIAYWTRSGSSEDMDNLLNTVEPGNIYLFHCTDNDLERLQRFIPAVTEMGYRLVTMNELFGYPENEVSPLTKTQEEIMQIPPLEPFEVVRVEWNKGNYSYFVKEIQQRLIDLGWLEGKADGEFGQNTFLAVGYFQQAVGIAPTGDATLETQEKLFAEDAPRREDVTIALATPHS